MSYKRFLAFADNHGSLVCDEALNKLKSFSDDWKPHYRIHLGDNWDFSPLRRGASQEELAKGISKDYEAGLRFIEIMRPNFITLGNHDDRIWQSAEKAADGMVREKCEELVGHATRLFARRKIRWVGYHVREHLRMPEGGPKLIHGFRSTMYPAKAHHENWGASLSGHVHKPDTYVARHADGSQSMSLGCLADISKLSYADRTPAKLGWRNGWVYGMINTKTGAWNAWHVINEDGVWISPQGIL